MYVSVITDITNKNTDKTFDYKVPEKLEKDVCGGMRVQVPFGRGNTPREGYIIEVKNDTEVSFEKVKSILSLPDKYPVLNRVSLELVKWMRDKYYTTLSACIQCVLPKMMKERVEKYVSINRGFENLSEEIEKLS